MTEPKASAPPGCKVKFGARKNVFCAMVAGSELSKRRLMRWGRRGLSSVWTGKHLLYDDERCAEQGRKGEDN